MLLPKIVVAAATLRALLRDRMRGDGFMDGFFLGNKTTQKKFFTFFFA